MTTTRLIRAAIFLGTALVIGFGSAAQAQTQPSVAKTIDKVFIVQPSDKAVVSSPFLVQFGLVGKKIGPVGDLDPRLGHHHLIIGLDSVEKDQFIPFDDKHMHFPDGQTETTLSLPPGRYKLTLQFGNGAHQSYGKTMSHTIHVEVEAAKAVSIALPPTAW